MAKRSNLTPNQLEKARLQCLEALEYSAHSILADASQALERSHLGQYERLGAGENWKRLQLLYDLVVLGVRLKTAAVIVRPVSSKAAERFGKGLRLREEQAAFNVLEEVIWERLAVQLCREDFVAAIGLVRRVINAGRAAVADTYIELAVQGVRPQTY